MNFCTTCRCWILLIKSTTTNPLFLPRPFPLGNVEALNHLIYSPSFLSYLCQNQTILSSLHAWLSIACLISDVSLIISDSTDGTTLQFWILKIETLKFEISCYLRKGQSSTASQRGNTEKKFRFYYFVMEIFNEKACFLVEPQLAV